ncbi:MAG: radical SAM protein [Thermoguttaceae bacterium]
MEENIDNGLSLARRLHPKYAPAFEKLSERDRAVVALYFLPHASEKDVLEVTRPRVIKWYCPFADQREFPSGHRYCINVYTGCQHECQYCYATGYVAAEPNCKNRFRHDLCKDLEALEAYDVPPAPVHLSNSTDPLQPLEEQHRHTLFVLERLAEYRKRFTSVTLLTKNPAVLMDERYVQVLHRLNRLPPDHPRSALFDANGYPPLRVECSLAFFNDEHRRLLDPAAPSVESRKEAMRFLRKEGLSVFPRIDPLFPRDPLGDGKRMADFGLPDVQSLCDLEGLVSFGRELAAGHIIYSAAKITRPKQGTLPPVMERMKRVYQHLSAGQPLVFHGGSWRLPENAAAALVLRPFLDLCGRYSIPAKPCKTNLITTP